MNLSINSIFPLLYATVLFLILTIVSFYIIQQIAKIQANEKRIIRLEKKIQNGSAISDDHYKLGQFYLRKKLFNKAILSFRKAVQSWDRNDQIGLGSLYNTLGFTYFSLKEYQCAIYYYEIAVKIIPDYILVVRNLGYTYEQLKLYSQAYKCYNRMLSRNKDEQLLISQLVRVKRKLDLQEIDLN
nr:hypothetical protein [Ishige okamurae]